MPERTLPQPSGESEAGAAPKRDSNVVVGLGARAAEAASGERSTSAPTQAAAPAAIASAASTSAMASDRPKRPRANSTSTPTSWEAITTPIHAPSGHLKQGDRPRGEIRTVVA